MTYLLDSNACIAFLKGDNTIASFLRKLTPSHFRLCSIVKAELVYGAHRSAKPAVNMRVLSEFFRRFESLSFDDECAEHYGEIRAMLAAKGTPIGPNDLLIASIARTHRLAIVTRNDNEFRRVPGLVVENY